MSKPDVTHSPGERAFCMRGHRANCSTKLSCFCSCHRDPTAVEKIIGKQPELHEGVNDE